GAAGPVPCLLLGERRDDAEAHGHPRHQRGLGDSLGGSSRYVFEVGRPALDHDADADDGRVAAARGECPRRLGPLQRARQTVNDLLLPGDAAPREGSERTAEQLLRDRLVEAPGGHGEAARAVLVRSGPVTVSSRRPTGHVSRGTSSGGARACHAWWRDSGGWGSWPGPPGGGPPPPPTPLPRSPPPPLSPS